ncbi:peptidylprolyl isomerase [Buchnera aphidicola]|uniref:peptidylprolyl isomerase n=1 Tax=Buchnera aphidicola TaxID=9 RepID=UPI00346464CA
MKVYFFLILCFFSNIFSFAYGKECEIDKIVAIVNHQIILNSDVNQVLFSLKKEDQEIKIPFKINLIRDKIIEKLIIDTLILEEARKFNVTVSDDQVNTILKRYALKQNITFNQLKNNIIMSNINDWFSYNDYIQNIKKSLKIKIIQDYVLNRRINISEKEVYFFLNKKNIDKNKFKKIDLNYILLPFLKEKNKILMSNTKNLADQFMQKIKSNSSFDYYHEYFKKNDKIFLSKKIRLNSLTNLKKILLNEVNIIKKGQILGPILGKDGFYIFKVDNIVENTKNNLINEFHIQHCLIRPSVILTNKKAKEDIFYIYKNIKNRTYSFDYAVENLSHDVYSSHKKGDLGWISSNFFNSDVNKILKNLKINDITHPIQSRFGWHIIKLLEIRERNKQDTLDRDSAYQILLKDKIKIEKDKWIEELKNSSYIKIL